jgi:phospholipid/cholesterol/gamma-HCH transport system ATP-binding protein
MGKKGTPPTLRPAPFVLLDDLTTIIDDTPVLYRLRLELPAGKITALMGPSGVGKTTVIKHIVGLLRPDGGTVRIDDEDIWDASSRRWELILSGLGAMLGGSLLITSSTFASLTVRDNLTYTMEALGVPHQLREERVTARLRELDLLDYADHRPHELPAHGIKRLALARALVTEAPLILLDEIDVGLDREHTPAMLEAVRALHERTGCTMLITTHTMDLAREVADVVAVLVNGRIVAQGPPAEVLRGIESSDELDQRFEFSDSVGPPPQLQDARTSADVSRAGYTEKPRMADRWMVWVAVAAVLLIAVCLLLVKVRLF